MPNVSELARTDVERAESGYQLAKAVYANLELDKSTREHALATIRRLERDYPHLGETPGHNRAEGRGEPAHINYDVHPCQGGKRDEGATISKALLVDISTEISRVNHAAGYTVFNPTVTSMVRQLLDMLN